MRSGTIPTSIQDVPASGRWYVTNGANAVGPIDLDLVVRGVEAGKVPLDSFVRHEAWTVWRPLSELAAAAKGRFPLVVTDDPTLVDEPTFSADRTPADALSQADDLPIALLLLLGTAVQSTASEAAIIYEVREASAVVTWAHGPDTKAVEGETVSLLDPVVLAAAAGAPVIAEPEPGPAGQAIRARLSKIGAAPLAFFMLPIRPRGRLLGMLEIGRQAPYPMREIARVETLVSALVARIEAASWG